MDGDTAGESGHPAILKCSYNLQYFFFHQGISLIDELKGGGVKKNMRRDLPASAVLRLSGQL